LGGFQGIFTAFFGCALALAPIASAQAPPDTIGGVASTQVILRLRADAFARSGHRRAAANADADAIPRTSNRFKALAANWRASKMRRVYQPAFMNPALAEKHGLDRTFILEVPRGTDTKRLANALIALSDEVETASTDGIGTVAADQLIPTDSQFNLQWNMHNIGQNISGLPGTIDADIDAPEAWALHTGVGSEQVVVAVLDSGILSHVEFGTVSPIPTGRLLPGYNTVLDSAAPANLLDNCVHGVHVAGIIGAAGNKSCSEGTSERGKTCEVPEDCAVGCLGGANSGQPCLTSDDCPSSTCGAPVCSAVGVAGVSWGAYLLPVKVFTNCNSSSIDLNEGIIWAADNGADVINISAMYNLTEQASITAMQNAVNYAHDSGVLIVAAAGNNDFCSNGLPPANDRVCFPARLAHVMAITATDKFDNLGTFSNYGAEVDVAAPGQDIRSTWSNGSYATTLGTSMAAPHVAGLAALIKSYVPQLTNDEIAEIITTTAEDKGNPGWDNRFGFGRINAHHALQAAAQWPGILNSNPPDSSIDAGRPIDPLTMLAEGWSSVEVHFPRDTGSVASTDFFVEQNIAGSAPIVESVEPLPDDWVRVHLDRPIEPLAWTTITHAHTGTRIRLGFLPGDVGGDSFTLPGDIIDLIDSLNGLTTLPLWSTDLDRTGAALPADIITLIDLLNGLPPFPQPYNGAFLPEMP